jgi:hypothetical protein
MTVPPSLGTPPYISDAVPPSFYLSASAPETISSSSFVIAA